MLMLFVVETSDGSTKRPSEESLEEPVKSKLLTLLYLIYIETLF